MALRAQSPNDSPPPPGPRPSSDQQTDRRERFKKMAEHFRQQRGGESKCQPQERAEHIREAMKHLKAAGLGQMAERIEESMKKMRRDGGNSSAGQAQDQQPPAPPKRGQFGGPQQFTRPAPLTPGDPAPMRDHGGRPHAGNNDDLQVQVQRLARQVEELRNMMQNRMGKSQGQDGSRTGEHHERRPQENGSHHRDRGREPQSNNNRDEKIKPALRPQASNAE